MVLAPVGLNVNLKKIVKMGFKPMLVGLALASIMAAFSLSLIHIMGIGA